MLPLLFLTGTSDCYSRNRSALQNIYWHYPGQNLNYTTIPIVDMILVRPNFITIPIADMILVRPKLHYNTITDTITVIFWTSYQHTSNMNYSQGSRLTDYLRVPTTYPQQHMMFTLTNQCLLLFTHTEIPNTTFPNMHLLYHTLNHHHKPGPLSGFLSSCAIYIPALLSGNVKLQEEHK